MKSSSSLALRAALAVMLMMGFYLLALAISGALFYVPYAEVVYLNHVTPKLDLMCIIAGGAILWAVLPRRDKFVPPGPLLAREQNPRLFDEIEGVAGSVGQEMPTEVYLVPDVNAWVSQRGGIMGFGSRRVMGLGLVLMRTLSVSQFRAVLAHEFGHYHGGDTKLGPWIYKTRNAIVRTLSSLGRRSWIQKPFLWYGNMFLRVTHAISRRQEFVADEVAARCVGSQPLITGLRAIHGTASAFPSYWRDECLPVLQAGFHPPLADGFNRFVNASPVADAIKAGLDKELKTGKADPYDTHPALKDRIAAVEHLPAGNVREPDAPALSLLGDVPALEKSLLCVLAGLETAGKLKPIDWADACEMVYLPQWIKLAKANAAALIGIPPESLPGRASEFKAFGKRFVYSSGQAVEEENSAGLAGAVIGAALVIAIANRGGTINAGLGETVSVSLGSLTVAPFGVMQLLASGKLSAEAWQRQAEQLGIIGIDLGKAAAADAKIKLHGNTPMADDHSRYMPKE